jgi:hypothetical protein
MSNKTDADAKLMVCRPVNLDTDLEVESRIDELPCDTNGSTQDVCAKCGRSVWVSVLQQRQMLKPLAPELAVLLPEPKSPVYIVCFVCTLQVAPSFARVLFGLWPSQIPPTLEV